jgi:hypothetical protein
MRAGLDAIDLLSGKTRSTDGPGGELGTKDIKIARRA